MFSNGLCPSLQVRENGCQLITVEYRVFYYPGARFDASLLIQSFIMIAIQLVLLKVALDHRPGPSSKGGEAATPFTTSHDNWSIQRPYNFWQWRSSKPYVFHFLQCVLAFLSQSSSFLNLTPNADFFYLQILALPPLPLHNPRSL